MQYGYFDDDNREYVITRPDTPQPWANYLGSTEYGALISNNAGGYSFVKSGANGRILRYIFNRNDQPGRYIYLRDNADGDYWSASWQPVGKDLAAYKSECRHGTAYTVISADYRDIHSEATFYVPLGKTHEVWELTVTNNSKDIRELTITGVAEFTNEGNYEQDQINLQYSLFITRTLFDENRIRQLINGNLDALDADDAVDNKNVRERFLGLVGEAVTSYCGDLSKFLGNYHGYQNPVGVEKGDLGNYESYNCNCCGALSCIIKLDPGESRTIAFILGEKGPRESAAVMAAYASPDTTCAWEVNELKRSWHEKLDRFKVKTPCPEFDSMINTWNAYNCFMTFNWSRAASFIYCGLRNGYGYRDTVQDIQGVIHLDPDAAADKIRFMLSAQVHHGGGLPLVKFHHNAGHEDTPEDESYVRETGHPAYRADDALWLFPTIYKYITESGNKEFLDEVIPFADKDEGTVYEHLKRALDFSLNHLGPHGMPAGLYADWNDCLRLGANGESSFVAFQFYYAFTILTEFARHQEDEEYIEWLTSEQEKLRELLIGLCWNEDRFIRGFTEAGEVIGDRNAPEANMWLNPQSWSVISGLADRDQAIKAMDMVHERLNTPYGAVIMDPPYHAHAFEGALAVIFNAGAKENGGIFSQSQGWLILAEALLGRGERAFEYFKENAPSMQNDIAEIRGIEPYCYGQFTEGKESPMAGRSHVHWLTGTASTVMVGCVEGILGMRPDLGGLKIEPSIPKSWGQLEIDKEFRGKKLHIRIENPYGKESGCSSLTVNGKLVNVGNYIPESAMEEENEIVMVM
ncbi:MAG: N,N'-diacetylchitobiose phosphorylase [Lachnospiraceae bacterium]|nr:N,N'-diacetylchitobiose phosphorylase [Lachnospiraceae bacterium]